MSNKPYSEYHVLDEEIDDVEIVSTVNKISAGGEVEIGAEEKVVMDTQVDAKEEIQADDQVDVKEEIEADAEVVQDLKTQQVPEEILQAEVIELREEASGYVSVLGDIEETENTEKAENIEDVGNTESIQEKLQGKEEAQVVVFRPVTRKQESTEQDLEKDKQDFNAEEEYTRQFKDENKQPKDTSFSSYMEADRKRERGFFIKWGTRLAKLILFIMLLPVICTVAGGAIVVVGGITAGIVTCIGGGIAILATTCFVATQVTPMIIALGISAGITIISFGGIILILCLMIIKGISKQVRQHRLNRKHKEVR